MPDLTASILHRVYLLLYYVGALYVKASRRLPRGAGTQRSIAAFPYYPEGLPGGEERIAMWKEFFEKDGIRFDVFWAADKARFETGFYSSKTITKYRFYFSVLFKRVWQLSRLRNYETLWIQRAAIPFYDVRSSFLEKCIKRDHQKLLFDFYDADYIQTPKQTWGLIAHSDGITVANPGLEKAISAKTDRPVQLFRLCLPGDVYPIVKSESDKIRIGWIGSPSNARYLQDILKPLLAIQQKYENRIQFNFVCRKEEYLPGLKINWMTFDNPNFEYYSWFSSIDIGLAIYPLSNENAAYKTSMKSLEYWASKTVLISGSYGISDMAQDGVNASICKDDKGWFEKLERLIVDSSHREKQSGNGYATFKEHHAFDEVYPKVKIALAKSSSSE